MSTTLKFSAPIQIIGVNPYILVYDEQVKALVIGWRKPLPVFVQIGSETSTCWQTNIMPNGKGDFYLYLHGDMRKHSKTKVGDVVTIYLSFNKAYRNGPLHPIPDWFKDALNKNSSASTNWELLSPSRQKEVLRYFYGLKSDDAKKRNIVKAINVLEGNPGHFMGRDWLGGK